MSSSCKRVLFLLLNRCVLLPSSSLLVCQKKPHARGQGRHWGLFPVKAAPPGAMRRLPGMWRSLTLADLRGRSPQPLTFISRTASVLEGPRRNWRQSLQGDWWSHLLATLCRRAARCCQVKWHKASCYREGSQPAITACGHQPHCFFFFLLFFNVKMPPVILMPKTLDDQPNLTFTVRIYSRHA